MPIPRRRALSISGDLQNGQLTVAQPRSAFINKLPLEIRRMIYEKTLGEQSIHTYSEAIEYLYKANQFFISTDLEDFPTAGYLSYFFQPQRIVQISNLTIEWDIDRHQYFNVNLMPDHHRSEWYRSWDGLSKMAGLRRLHIKFYFCLDLWQGCYGEFWERNSKELLQPIKRITAPRDFLITLPNWQCSTDIDVGESRCVFKLPERVGQEGNAS
ncbi:uncharacterized protein ALTATR162_LOCUS6147 [Alternaria atra]|uniref:DUF7730 domain-containing protein n=1 Tax=Alternaria atra TaxID=119953 RepID=A0A8J2I967_9PLEO|nr:uncharacterized protein ALTATR162_LOCUS6147 [Alternaria atra]CAG5162033.1 unnamed protein product [Alternaria atra]